MAPGRLLVAGSYPPIPGPAAAATVAAVRRAWADGYHVEVVSPRPSAAHHHARLAGRRAPMELGRLRRRRHVDDLILCLEPGMPFAEGVAAAAHRAEVALLTRTLTKFRKVTIIVTGDLGVKPDTFAPLWRTVQEVVTRSDEDAEALVEQLHPPSGLVRVDPRGYPDTPTTSASYRDIPAGISPSLVIRARAKVARDAAEAMAGASVLGPLDWEWHEQPRRLVSVVARRVLGSRTDEVRTWLVRRIRRRQVSSR
jgi:hypothetical protein